MKNFFCCSILIFLVSLIFCQPANGQKYRLVIKVLSADRHEPIEGAAIHIENKTSGSSDIRYTTSDWEGAAYREYAYAGAFTISAEATGFDPSVATVVINPKEASKDFPVTLLLKRKGGVKVVTVNLNDKETGAPVIDANVLLEGGIYRFKGTTNSSGQVVLPVNHGGSYAVSITHRKYKSINDKLTIKEFDDTQKEYNLSFDMSLLAKANAELVPLNVYVKGKNNKPVVGAAVSVTPGRSGVTDASGFAKAWHMQQPGEYIEVLVSANGYKDQQQRVLVGTGQGNAITRPQDVVRFILEKGDNDREVYKIVVEVVDDVNYKPVSGAAVKMQLSDGTSYSGSTNGKGEAMFSEADLSFTGTTARVMVTHKDYKEKWSDITQDLMTAKDLDVRRFSVAISKKEPAGSLRLSGPEIVGKSRKETWAEYDFSATSVTLKAWGDPPDKKTTKWDFAGIPGSLSPGQEFTITITGSLDINPGADLNPPASAGVRFKGLEVISQQNAYISVKTKRDGKYVFKVPAGAKSVTIEIGADYGSGIFAIYRYEKP